MSALAALEEAVSGAVATAGPAVVGIGQGWGLGSGVVVGEGLVLTNAHNVRGGEASVTFADGRTVAGQVAGVDIDADLAVIRVDTGDATPLPWDPAATTLAVGTVVVALANPGGRGLRATLGQVSSLGRSFRGPRGRRVTGTVEHTAPLVRGSSGGPVVDAAGRFAGLNTNRLGGGFYAAIPADADLRAQVDKLASGESPRRRHLGVGVLPPRATRHLRRSVGLPDREGTLVRVVEEGSAADRAGLRQGDLIVEAAGSPVRSVDDLHAAVDRLGEGESLALGLVRGTEELAVSVTFGPARDEGSA